MPHTAHPSLSLRLLRGGFRYLGPHFPDMAGRLAYRLWFSTQRYPEPVRERHWTAAAQIDSVAWQGRHLIRYQWGRPEAPAVLLVHGWNGRGPQLGAFAAPLNDAGLRVVAFDAPGHGRSPGRSTNIFEFADAILTVARASGPVTAAVAHSFGVPACARALVQGWEPTRLVAIAAPASAEFLLARFARILDIPDSVIQAMRRRVERRFGMDIFARLATDEMLAGRDLPGLIIHDRKDRDVPDGHAEALHRAWRNTRLMLTDGLGHRRILRDHRVIAETVRFLRGDAAT